MVMLFGWEFQRKNKNQDNPTKNSSQFAPEVQNDGAVVVAAGGQYGTYMDMDGTIRTDVELISKYREMAMQPELDIAIENICNDAIVQEEDNPILSLNIDKVQNLTPKLKQLLIDEFNEAMQLLDFNMHAYDIFRSYYVDGRLYYNVVIDNDNPTEGIQRLIYIDPRKIKRIRSVAKKKVGTGNDNTTPIAVDKEEYYIYNEKGFGMSKNISNYTDGNNPVQGIKIAKDTVIYITSGLTDGTGKLVLSYLHKAIKSLNSLRSLEDATVIYRISRAPERRVFYIDVGNLPKIKAEQYLRDMMVLHKNKLVYDGSTGQILDDRKFMTMTEDFWLPRREGSKGTEILTLPAGQNLGKMEDVEYFQKKLFRALHVPFDRLQNDNNDFGNGETTASITREEMKFARFIDRIRMKFSELFREIIGKNVVLKGYMTIEEWVQIAHNITFDYAMDNYSSEIKEREILTGRLTASQLIEPLIGRYYSNEWVRKHVLCQTDEQIDEIDAQIANEQTNPQYMRPEEQEAMQGEVQGQQDFENQLALQKAKPIAGKKK